MSSWDAWDECEVLISLFLGLGKIWTSLGLKWLKEIEKERPVSQEEAKELADIRTQIKNSK